MITITKSNWQDLRGLRFCIVASNWKSKNIAGPTLQYLHVKDKIVTATNGHRIHQYTLQNVKIENGLYEIVKSTKTIVIINKTERPIEDYPDFEPVFPTESMVKIFTMGVTIDGTYAMSSRSFCNLIREPEDRFGLNFSYFIDLGIDEERHFNVSYYGNDKPVMFEGENYKAVIMPIVV